MSQKDAKLVMSVRKKGSGTTLYFEFSCTKSVVLTDDMCRNIICVGVYEKKDYSTLNKVIFFHIIHTHT